MVHIFSVYAMDVTSDSYTLHVDASNVASPDTLKRIAKEVADQLNRIPTEDYPETDAPVKSWDIE